MKINEYTVHFETLTPLRAGDAWFQNKAPLKASSIMGSLRFWFEVICYFGGITKKEDYTIKIKKGKYSNKGSKANFTGETEIEVMLLADLKYRKFSERLVELIKKNEVKSSSADLVNEVLAEMEIPLPARVFGCTGWCGMIGIRKIEYERKNGLKLDSRIGISKANISDPVIRNDECPKHSNERYSVHRFPESFYGSFDITFTTDSNTARRILFPLLKFVEQYGYLGGAWSKGYGRVKVNFGDDNGVYDRFSDYAEFTDNPVSFGKIINKVSGKDELLSNKTESKNIRLLILGAQGAADSDVKAIMEKLVKEKVFLRKDERDRIRRHLVFGTTGDPEVHGSKVLPWIRETGREKAWLEYGFISIADILHLGEMRS
ncbi:MAG TPA: RAMP superfamily CRISPR-associated protein [Parasegetibacter sp.]